jgi:hypothetical protein
MALDGDPFFTFQVHIIQHLVHHIAVANGLGMFQQPVGQCTFTMVNMRDDAKIPDILHNGCKDKPEVRGTNYELQF